MTPDSSNAALDAALPELLGTSRPMRELLALVRQGGAYASTVLLTGGSTQKRTLIWGLVPAAREREDGPVARDVTRNAEAV